MRVFVEGVEVMSDVTKYKGNMIPTRLSVEPEMKWFHLQTLAHIQTLLHTSKFSSVIHCLTEYPSYLVRS